MKRVAFIVLFLSGVLTVASGFFSAVLDAQWLSRVHVGIGILFVLMIVGHVRDSVRTSRRTIRTSQR